PRPHGPGRLPARARRRARRRRLFPGHLPGPAPARGFPPEPAAARWLVARRGPAHRLARQGPISNAARPGTGGRAHAARDLTRRPDLAGTALRAGRGGRPAAAEVPGSRRALPPGGQELRPGRPRTRLPQEFVGEAPDPGPATPARPTQATGHHPRRG